MMCLGVSVSLGRRPGPSSFSAVTVRLKRSGRPPRRSARVGAHHRARTVVPCLSYLTSSEFGPQKPLRGPLLAAVTPAVLACKALLLRLRTENLTPLAILKD